MVENIILLNKISGAKLELSATKTPFYILENVDWGQVSGNANTYKFLNQFGESVENIVIGNRPISIVGWIIADTEDEMSARKWMLNLFVNPQQEMDLIYDNYKITFYPETSIQYSATVRENNEVLTRFKISGISYNPLFKDSKTQDVDAAKTKGNFHFPLIINQDPQTPPMILFGVREPSLITTIINKGQVETGFTLVFSATSEVENPYLINVVTQEFIKINKKFVAGEKVEINTQRGEHKIVGTLKGQVSSYAKFRDLDMSWIQLKVGENVFRYNADSNPGGLDVFINFSNKFLEVQKCF